MNLYNGWLIVDKPKGTSSNDAVQKVKRLVGKANKVGHAGTLDPLAQGVLPIAIGEATKTVQYMMDATKEYEFDVSWGEERITGDAEGEIIAKSNNIPDIKDIEGILPEFIGEISQMPPIYSALKINGQPAYKLARKGEEVKLAPRKIKIENFRLIDHNQERAVSRFKVLCGKGTYVRSLAVDIAKALLTCGYVSYLKRTKVGNFFINDAIMLANLMNIVHNDEIQKHLLPVTYGLGDILAIEVSADQVRFLRNGVQIFLQNHSQTSKQLVQILEQGVLQAIACMDKGLCRPIRVFNL